MTTDYSAAGKLSPFVARPEVTLLLLLERVLKSYSYLPLAFGAQSIY